MSVHTAIVINKSEYIVSGMQGRNGHGFLTVISQVRKYPTDRMTIS